MKMLVVGAGVIGTVYGAHIAAAGSGEQGSWLSHGPRTSEVAAAGLSARDVLSGGRVDTEADVVPDASGDYDLCSAACRAPPGPCCEPKLVMLAQSMTFSGVGRQRPRGCGDRLRVK